MSVFTYFYFLFLIFVSFYIPGALLLHITKIRLSKFEHILFALFFGSFAFLILSYLCLLLNMPQAMIFILELFFILFLFRKHFGLIMQKKHEEQPNIAQLAIQDSKVLIKNVRQLQIKTLDVSTLAIMLGGIILLASAHFFSGLQTTSGITFIGVDAFKGIAHLAEIKAILIDNPTGTTNIYAFLISRFAFLFALSVEDLYFRLFPFLLSFIFIGGVFCLTRTATNIHIVRLSLILSCLIVGSFLFQATYWSFEKSVGITASTQKLFDYFAKEVERDKSIIYLEKDVQKRNIVTVMTGRKLYQGDQRQLQLALQQCNEGHVQKALKEMGSAYVLSRTNEPCLASEKIRGTKLASKEFYFYEVRLN